MVNGVDESRLGRIRKLLVKAERAGTPEEAMTYTQKAAELMARHGVDAALLAAAEPGRDEIGATRVDIADPYSAGKARLLAWTAGALRCRALLHQVYGGRVTAVTVFGFASDRERVELLFTSLLLQAANELGRCRPVRRGESVAAYRRSWLHGFAIQVHRRLAEAEERAARSRDDAAAGARGGPDGGGAGGPPRPGGAGVRRGVPGHRARAPDVAVRHGVRGGRGRGEPGGPRRAAAVASAGVGGVRWVGCGGRGAAGDGADHERQLDVAQNWSCRTPPNGT